MKSSKKRLSFSKETIVNLCKIKAGSPNLEIRNIRTNGVECETMHCGSIACTGGDPIKS